MIGRDLSRSVAAAVEEGLRTVRTLTPAKVVRYHHGPPRYADVQPLLRDEEGRNLPEIRRVPVAGFRFGPFSISAPLAAGDEVLVGFADQSIDEWLERGGRQTPGLIGGHELSDAIILGALNSFANPDSRASGDDLVIAGPSNLEVRLTAEGTIAIGNGSAELLDVLDQMLDALLATTVETEGGPQPLSTAIGGAASTLGQIQALLALLRT